MTWFDIVKKVKVDSNIVKEIFQEIISRDKRVIINNETTLELLNKYQEILTERAKNKLYNQEGKKIISVKVALGGLRRHPKRLAAKIHGYVRNLYPQLKTSGGAMYFINENEMNKYISEHPLRMKESLRRGMVREGR